MREWLPSGTTIARYRISSRLSANGLGEVYLARDASTNQEIALKLLPASLIKEQKTRQRFFKIYSEIAKIRHRNLCEIYGGWVAEEDRPYIVMEYLRGQSFDTFSSGNQMSINEVVALVIQIADGLEAAHSKRWLHLAIKPSNLILYGAQQVKVLDLGQALAFPRVLDDERGGLLQITPNDAKYLSPEQVAGDEVDQRSDIFSLGSVFYELLVGHTPFIGTTLDEVKASVIVADPITIIEYRDDLPQELVRIVHKAIAKDPADRYQTAGELAHDLRTLYARHPKWTKWTTGSTTESPEESGADFRVRKTAADLRGRNRPDGATGDRISASSFIADLRQAVGSLFESRKNRKSGSVEPIKLIRERSFFEDLLFFVKNSWRKILIITLLLIGMIWAIVVAGRFLNRTVDESNPRAPQISSITASGKVTEAVISNHGERLAYAVDDGVGQSIIIKEIDSGKESKIASTPVGTYRGLTFARDGRTINYIKVESDGMFGSLYSSSVIQGDTHTGTALNKVVAVGAVGFSADGKQIAYLSSDESGLGTALNVGPIDGEASVIAKRMSPAFFTAGGLSWSPDGRLIACVIKDAGDSLYQKVVVVEIDTGSASTLSAGRWSEISGVVWLNNGAGLIVSAIEPTSRVSQLWQVAYPSGQISRLTNDLSDYRGVSLTDDSARLVSVQSEALSNIWVAPGKDLKQLRQVTSDKFDGVNGLGWVNNDRLIYVSQSGGRETIWIDELKTNRARPLPVAPDGDAGGEYQPAVSPDGKTVAYIVERSAGAYLWRSDVDRRNMKAVMGENLLYYPSFTSDGKNIVYSALRDEQRALAMTAVDGGKPVVLIGKNAWRAVISPDGAKVVCNYFDERHNKWKVVIFPLIDRQPVVGFDIPGDYRRVVRWTPNGAGLAYIVTHNGVSNIMLQPLDGGSPKQITDYKSGRIFDFVWSHDGENIAFAKGWVSSDAVSIQNVLKRER